MEKSVNINSSKKSATLVSVINRGKFGAERKYGLSNEPKLRFIIQEICARNGGSIALFKDEIISSQYIIQQMAYNYANLLRVTTESMRCIFTDENMTTLLLTNCKPIWEDDFSKTPYQMVMHFYKIKSLDDLDNNPEVKNLLEKLKHLSSVENLALIDICEQFWRNKRSGSIKENLKQLRLDLA